MEHKIKKLFENTDTLAADSTHLFTVPNPDEIHREPQGGCSDGKYYYQTFMYRDTASNEENNTCYIAKIDMQNGEVIKWSEKFTSLNHSNDIVYNPKKNILLLVHNNPHRERVSIIDPETLELIKTVIVPFNIYAIDYSIERDRYVVALSGGQDIAFLDGELNAFDGVRHPSTDRARNHITQGICSDEELIYCVLWDGRNMMAGKEYQDVITVYDWDGNFVGLIEFEVGKIESENITAKHGDLTVIANDHGAAFFRIVPKAK